MGELGERQQVLDAMFRQYDRDTKGELTPRELQQMHESLRIGGISIPQVVASMAYCCAFQDTCDPSELFAVLQEMDRRYFLLQDFRWEFAFLDREQKGFITEEQARFMFEAVHGNLFSRRRWERFLRSRAVRGSGISFEEIEVDLCNIPSRQEIAMEEYEELREREERNKKHDEKRQREEEAREARRKQLEDEKRKKLEAESKKGNEERRRKKEEEERLQQQRELEQKEREEEERGRREAEEREEERLKKEMEEKEKERQRELEIIEVQQALEAQRELERKAIALQEEERAEEEKLKNVEDEAEEAADKAKQAEEEAKKAAEAVKKANDAASKKAAEEAEKAAKEKAKRERHNRIRKELKVAIKEKDKAKLQKSVKEFKENKLADTEGDLAKAESILKRFKARDDLMKAMDKRNLEELEKAINFVKKHGYEAHMPQEMIQANKMLLSLKRLKRLRDEILNLKQSTVAEIRSYSKPPPQVHKVMISTYLLLGNKEKQLQDWKGMQALIGKTGKEGLKRRVMECDPNKIPVATAERTSAILAAFDLEQVRDVSAGAAVFYAWSSATAEDVVERENQKAAGADPAELKKGSKTIKTEMKSGNLTITI
ncbi:uncharacterized protein [Diadema setosum]|uniref:uncharacterized protein n=1 Tax=Diadema setosum TaxID=31175 RepID=UPI003B3BE1C4